MVKIIALLVLSSTLACSSRDQADCDRIAQEIRTRAAARNIPSQGACNSTVPGAEDLKAACDELRKCNDEVD
jgi:hypothetical protein